MKKRNYKTPKLDVWALSAVMCLVTSGNNFDMTESDFNGDNPFVD